MAKTKENMPKKEFYVKLQNFKRQKSTNHMKDYSQ